MTERIGSMTSDVIREAVPEVIDGSQPVRDLNIDNAPRRVEP